MNDGQNLMSRALDKLAPCEWLGEDSSPDDVREVIAFLEAQGTFEFPVLPSGLFSAAAAGDPEFRLTGYQNVWVRDNIHIAHAHWRLGKTEVAARAVSSLLEFYERYEHRLEAAVSGDADLSDPMQRPHIRFDGERLTENSEKWSHAQNDALGGLLWLAAQMIHAGDLECSPTRGAILGKLITYLGHLPYWEDEDSGHWEEARKIEASSIGVVVAGMTAIRQLSVVDQITNANYLEQLIDEGRRALNRILPAECIQDDPQKSRRYDSALLFLVYPLQVVQGEMARHIVDDVRGNLMGPIGIRRYPGDSYWCADYRTLISADERTSDFSDDMSKRDSLLNEGQEAQWCIFDPIMSVYYAEQYRKTGTAADRRLQIVHLQRSLAQLTDAQSRFPAYRCPESWFLEAGTWIPNDICPLLWTQANLRLALEAMLRSVA